MKTVDVKALLEASTVSDVLGEASTVYPCLCFHEEDTVEFVLEQFSARDLISALVLRKGCTSDSAKGSEDDRMCTKVRMQDVLGFIDLNVILQALLRRAFESNVVEYDAASLEQVGTRFCSQLVGGLLRNGDTAFHGQMAHEWALKGNKTASLLSIIRECFLFTKKPGSMRPPKIPARSIHRVAIYSSDGGDDGQGGGELCGFISQTDIIRFLHEHEQQAAHSHAIGGSSGMSIFHKTVKDLGLVGYTSAEVPPSPSTTSSESSDLLCKTMYGPRVTLVPHTVTALEAFRRMCMHRDSGVGVLGDDGTLRASLSATAIRDVAQGAFHRLLMKVDQYIDQGAKAVQAKPQEAQDSADPVAPVAKRARTTPARGAGLRRTGSLASKGVLTCQATSTLAEVMGIMSKHCAHRVYVVDPDCKPLCAITVADVLRVVVDSATLHRGDSHRGDSSRGATPTPVEAASKMRKLESVTSGASDRAASVCTSVQSEHRVLLPGDKVP